MNDSEHQRLERLQQNHKPTKAMRKAVRKMVMADLQRRAITGGASPFKSIGVGEG